MATAALGDEITFSVTAKGTNLTYQWMKGGVAISGATSASYTIATVALTDAAPYAVKVSGSGGGVTSDAATLSIGSHSAPTIGSQPTSVAAPNNGKASFSVTAYGSGTLVYQWYKDNVPISGAKSRSYSIAKVSSASTGVYYVTVTNAYGSVQSANASLSLMTDPMITAQPQSYLSAESKVRYGDYYNYTAQFEVTATGSGTLTYQWYKDGVKLAGQQGATLRLATVTASDAGNYSVDVTSSAGTTRSSAATLTLVDEPRWVVQPQDVTAHVGGTATFTFRAESNAGTVIYHPYRNHLNVGEVTSDNEWTWGSITQGDAGDGYFVVAAVRLGDGQAITAVASRDAVLTVIP